jgi:RHS repeat-associated protein
MQAIHAKLYRYFKVRSNVSLSFAYEESGLDYAMNRYFANTTGRFQSPDKGGINIGVPASLNRYVYAVNDPIKYTDPTGRRPAELECSRMVEINPAWECQYATARPLGGLAEIVDIIEPRGSPWWVAERRITIDLARASGLPVDLIGTDGWFLPDQKMKVIDSLFAIKSRFERLEDCRKLFGFGDAPAALNFLKGVSISALSITSQVSWTDYVAANLIATGITVNGKVYLVGRAFDGSGNKLDDVILHEMRHLLLGNSAEAKEAVDSAQGRHDLSEKCQTGQ